MKKISKNLAELIKKSPAVKKQFFCGLNPVCNDSNDPLQEDSKYLKTKGLIHKYPKRALIMLSKKCGAYCSFCSRKRFQNEIENYSTSREDISKMAEYIRTAPDMNEIILSGGDPLLSDNLDYAIKTFSKIPQIKIIRIHTRAILSAPDVFNKNFFESLKKSQKKIYISFHINHPDELTPIAKKIINECRENHIIVLTQTVFLKGINDSAQILEKLFCSLSELGAIPYYIHRCDKVKGLENFIVPIEKEIEIMTKLQAKLSGIALPKHVIDTPFGYGKIPVPQNFWEFDKKEFKDYKGKKYQMY